MSQHPATPTGASAKCASRFRGGWGVLSGLLICCSMGCSSMSLFRRDDQKDHTPTFEAARHFEEAGHLTEARDLYSGLLVTEPRNLDAYHRLAIVQAKLGETQESLRLFDEATRISPGNAVLMNDYGCALYMAGKLEQAEIQLQHVYQFDPENERTISNLAMVLGAQGRREESLALYRKIVSETEAQSNVAQLSKQPTRSVVSTDPLVMTAVPQGAPQSLLPEESLSDLDSSESIPIIAPESDPIITQDSTLPHLSQMMTEQDRIAAAIGVRQVAYHVEPGPILPEAEPVVVALGQELITGQQVESRANQPGGTLLQTARVAQEFEMPYEWTETDLQALAPVRLGESIPGANIESLTHAAAAHLTRSSARPYGINETPLPVSEPSLLHRY
ncbi:MAG: tetratricopeptide repeat protein [Planctomycetaceae bacterium]